MNEDQKKELLRKLASDAIAVQDACNLSGVVFSFAKAMQSLCDMGLDTAQRNEHPIAILFSSKIASLTGSEHSLVFSKAYDWAKYEAS